MTSRIDAADKLYRQGVIDRSGLAALRIIGAALELIRVERGWPRENLWAAIKASQHDHYRWRVPVGVRRTPAEVARWRIAGLRNAFAREHRLPQLDTLVAVALSERLPVAARELVELVEGLNLAAQHLAEPSPRGRKRGAGVVAKIAEKMIEFSVTRPRRNVGPAWWRCSTAGFRPRHRP